MGGVAKCEMQLHQTSVWMDSQQTCPCRIHLQTLRTVRTRIRTKKQLMFDHCLKACPSTEKLVYFRRPSKMQRQGALSSLANSKVQMLLTKDIWMLCHPTHLVRGWLQLVREFVVRFSDLQWLRCLHVGRLKQCFTVAARLALSHLVVASRWQLKTAH